MTEQEITEEEALNKKIIEILNNIELVPKKEHDRIVTMLKVEHSKLLNKNVELKKEMDKRYDALDSIQIIASNIVDEDDEEDPNGDEYM